MTDSQGGSIQQYVARADSSVRSVRPSLKSLVLKKADEDISLSRADSVFFFASDTSFEKICLKVTDVDCVLTPSRWANPVGADTVAISPKPLHSTVADSRPLELTARGSSPIRLYSGAVVLTVLVALVAICVIRATSRTIISDVFGLISNSIGWRRFEQSQLALKGFSLFLLNAVYFVLVSVFATESLMLLASHLFAGWNVYMVTGAVILAVLLFYALRLLSDAVIGFAFHVEANLRLLTVYRRSSRAIIGVLLLPLVLIMPFVSERGGLYVVWGGFSVIIAITIIRLVKTLRINLANGAAFFYFILYLCIVEALPLACFLKIALAVSLPAGK